MDYFANVIRRIGGIGTTVGAVFLIGVMLLIVANIVYRILGGVIAGTYELIGLLIVVTAAFAIVYAALERGHVAVNIIVSRLPQRPRAILESFTLVIGLGLWALIAWGSVRLISESVLVREKTVLLGVPFLPFRCFWELGLLLFCLVLLIDLVKVLSRMVNK